jgi:hypothetical protein
MPRSILNRYFAENLDRCDLPDSSADLYDLLNHIIASFFGIDS